MLSDPQSITIGSSPGAVSVPRTSTGNGSSTYTSADGTVEVILSSEYRKRTRRVARVNMTKIATDVFLPDTNKQVSASVFLVIDQPVVGFTAAELKDMVSGLLGLLSASSYSVTTKLLGGES